MIEINDLIKDFKLGKQQRKELQTKESIFRAVDDISFTCKPGKVFSLLGPNGAGKTTTLRMISTIFKPTSGTVKICGLDAEKQAQVVRKKIGFLTGSTGLYARLNPDELITYFGKLYGISSAEIEKRKEDLYSLLDMHHFRKKRIGKLSTGMKQKVSIVRTMIHDPEVVVFDEPTSGLDVITAENIISLIRRCKDEKKTVIFSSHIMSEVDLLCDDLAIIDQGRLLYNGSLENFKSNMTSKNLTEEFIHVVNQNRNETAA